MHAEESSLPTSAAVLGLVVVSTALALWPLQPPAIERSRAAEEEFSAERATRHLSAIASVPHPTGSAANQRVRDYLAAQLAALGLTPTIHSTTAVQLGGDGTVRAARVHNVLARRGSGSGKTVLLAAHYDSEIISPGAGDNASAVAALLEIARALAAGPPLRNDVLFLFTDGHEPGLLGAQAFVAEHPWAASVGAVFNFDARGTRGPVIMFEKSPGSLPLVEALVTASPFPLAASFSEYVYGAMPNSTDFSVFRRAGLAGLNFAFLGGSYAYHTPLDRPRSLDLRSLQHQGSYGLALARHLGNRDLSDLGDGGESVYFNVLGRKMAAYPASWSLPLGLVAASLVLVVVARGAVRRRLSPAAVLGGALWLVLVTAAVWLVFTAAGRALYAAGVSYRALATDHSGLFSLAFVLLAVACATACYRLARRWLRAEDLAAGAALVWAALAVGSAAVVPQAAYLFAWPLLFAAAGLALSVITAGDRAGDWRTAVALAVCCAPAILLWVPATALVAVAYETRQPEIVGSLVALLLGLLAPVLAFLVPRRGWPLPAAALAGGLALLVACGVLSRFDAEFPAPSSVLYALDADDGEALWASFDGEPAAWSAQFLTGERSRKPFEDWVQLSQPLRHRYRAPALGLPPPELEAASEEGGDGVRTLRLRLRSPRRARVLHLSLRPAGRVRALSIDGKAVELPASWAREASRAAMVLYFGPPPEGVDVAVGVERGQTLRVDLVDESPGLPRVPGRSFSPRPPEQMPNPYVPTDSTFVRKSYAL